jgi:hypothetical protein
MLSPNRETFVATDPDRRRPVTFAFACDPPPAEWTDLLRHCPHLLVEGPRHATAAFVEAVMPWLRPPVVRLTDVRRLRLPLDVGAAILDDVDRLTRVAQRQLLRRLEMNRPFGTQLVSIATAPLYRDVEAGIFLPGLYYHLNTVRLTISA